MGALHQDYNPTDPLVSLQCLTQTLQKSFRSTYRGAIWYHCVGHLLLYTGDESEATTAFEQAIQPSQSNTKVVHGVFCNMCGKGNIQGLRYVCRTCPTTNLCNQCFVSYRKGKPLRSCAGHSFLIVPKAHWKALQTPHVNEAGETLDEWADRLRWQWNAKNVDPEIGRR
jgi:hypothetical protein